RLTINALAQNQRAETLSAPKLLTVDGQAAEINIGKTYYFPESWDTLEVSIESTGNDTASRSYYRWSYPSPDINKEGTTLGVYLWVRPTVQPDNETIRLELKPRISAYLGQDHGDGRYDVKVYTVNVETKEQRVRTFPIWRAKTSRRSLELTVDVHDGEPVVVGGIIDNSTVNRTDKIPILGDLPLIGRFFQSQAENSNKQNLIMFVTARQIDFSGVPVKRRSHTTAIPDLNH
ncbi:MAG: type II and III secretion system protein, partial [Clostridia bacterium]|nr:type II and III secretion system protein [Clostridia bacterium]